MKEQTGCKNKKNKVSVGMFNIEMIDSENNKADSKLKVNYLKTKNRYSPGLCKICGEHFMMITNSHAQKHGFKNADEMAQSDKIIFCIT